MIVSLFGGIILMALALVCFALYGAYDHACLKELKRQARHGNRDAARLYRPAAYGVSLRLMLAGTAMVCTYAGLYLVQRAAGGAWGLGAAAVYAGMAVAAVSTRCDGAERSAGRRLAVAAAPLLGWVQERTQPIMQPGIRLFRRLRPVHLHTGVYEKADIVELLERQKGQPDNRISAGEIVLLTHALTFGDKHVSDAYVPKRRVKAVAASDLVGPVLLDELYASGHSRFPVYEGAHSNIVGVLYLHDVAALQQSEPVRQHMRTRLSYVHEDFTLYRTLQAFLNTKQQLCLVVNDAHEYVGIITIEAVVERIIGRVLPDEFDQYDDARAVAAAAARNDHAPHANA